MLLHLDPVYSYSYFKAAVVEIFGQIEEHQLEQLLHACDLDDCKPVELLAEMRKLLGAKNSTIPLKKLLKDRLPSNVRRVLVAGPMDNLDDVARRSDRVVADGPSPTSNFRFVAALHKLLADKVDPLAKSFNSFFQQHPAPRTVTSQTNSIASKPMASTNRDSNFQRLSFSRPRFTAFLTKGLLEVVFRPFLAHRWEIYIFTTQVSAAMLFTAYRLALGGACCSPLRKH